MNLDLDYFVLEVRTGSHHIFSHPFYQARRDWPARISRLILPLGPIELGRRRSAVGVPSSLAVRDSWHQAARWAPCPAGTEEPAGERLAWASFPEMRRLFPCLGIGKVVVEGQRGGELQNWKFEVFWWLGR